ncbi:hypothetical protein T4B_9427 [Trichinella pseudospiralis]|uniref:Uncharacterized protein n=1 Tax=Trichinella pseudospiralis TaxID=6337 RepID=A0A0V1IAV1_TRIPS|nr:hypothetical protein T4A_4932 [Trichinella pseudospiralis]KRZ19930.1 hypothetical protein T4B_9427 [Trichinella pseudospiralis]KRZ28239.1 hypothetical protein T4C_1270 [Trichinella pseudospiralis]
MVLEDQGWFTVERCGCWRKSEVIMFCACDIREKGRMVGSSWTDKMNAETNPAVDTGGLSVSDDRDSGPVGATNEPA